MDENEIKRIVRVTVKEVLLTMGADVSTPSAVQALQRDFQFLRDRRTGAKSLLRNSGIALVAAAVTGAINLLWLTLQDTFHIIGR